MSFEEMKQAALKSAKEAQKQAAMRRLPDGNLYNYGPDKEAYLTRQCAMLVDQNIHIDAKTLYGLQPECDIRYSVQQIQAWLAQHPHYYAGRY